MSEKEVKKLREGDQLVLDNGIGIVTRVERSRLFEAAPGNGGAYELEWRDQAGERGGDIVCGNDCVQVP